MFACRTRNEKRRLNLKSLRRYAPGIYFCVCSCRYSNKIFHKMLVFQQKTYYFQYIYILASLTENGIPPEPNPYWCKLNILDSILHSPQSLLYRCQIRSMHSLTRRTPQKRTLKISLRHLLVNLKNVRVFAPLMFSNELWRQWQPLIFPPIQASHGALRFVKHERHNLVILLGAAE